MEEDLAVEGSVEVLAEVAEASVAALEALAEDGQEAGGSEEVLVDSAAADRAAEDLEENGDFVI